MLSLLSYKQKFAGVINAWVSADIPSTISKSTASNCPTSKTKFVGESIENVTTPVSSEITGGVPSKTVPKTEYLCNQEVQDHIAKSNSMLDTSQLSPIPISLDTFKVTPVT